MEVFYIKQQLAINEQIRDKVIQLVSDDGKVIGQMSPVEAMKLAIEKDLDLVKVAPNANPPVCKILDYGKYRFEMEKKEKEAKKNHKTVDIKEIRMTPNTESHDLGFKIKNARKFLEDGNKVKVSVRFRGRELSNTSNGRELLNKIAEELSEISSLDRQPLMEGKSMSIMLSPKKG